jgi:hypothetical protein
MKKHHWGLGAVLALFVVTQAWADEVLKPFILGETPPGDRTQVVDTLRKSLHERGFQVVGSYEPYPNATIVAVTSDELKTIASRTEFGGYGAAQRVAITEVNGMIQVAYTNPCYIAAAYRMQDSLTGVKAKLVAALGKRREYGSSEGVPEKDLRKYRYMLGMERFDSTDKHLLTRYKTHQEALNAVEEGLATGRGGVSKVYRIDIPGKEESVFGVAIREGEGADKYIMDRIDSADVRSTPHLPYEILVSGNKAYHLFARFRIAMNFPDLSIAGHNSFMAIMSAPGAIQKSLATAASRE